MYHIMNKIFITGSTGHVGKIIFERLADSFNVTTINRSATNHHKANNIHYNHISDYLNSIKIQQNDFLIHIASDIDFNNMNQQVTYFNTYETHKLFSCFINYGLKNVILISSAPIVENENKLMNEKQKVTPLTVYHLSKYYQEKLIELLPFEKFYSFRISSPISPVLDKVNIFKVFMDKAIQNENIMILGKGSRVQNYIDVRDIADLVKNTITNKYKSGTYNICSEESISNLDLAQTIIKTIGSKSQILFEGMDENDNQKWIYDINKAKENLLFNPVRKIENTIIDYFNIHK